jgi:hypothetical protein
MITVTTYKGWSVRVLSETYSGPGVVHRGPGGEADMVHIPETIYARIVDLPWDVTFTLRMSEGDDPVPELDEVNVKRRPGGEAPPADVGRLFRMGEAIMQAKVRATGRLVPVEGTERRWVLEVNAVDEDRVRSATRKHSGRRRDVDLRPAVAAYNDAKATGRPHLAHIMTACNVSRATASRYVRRAIDAGLIEED